MSVWMVILRLELPTEARSPASFDFATERHSKQLYEPVVPRFYDSKAEFQAAVKRARGKRNFRSYRIETYSPADVAKRTMAQGANEKPAIRSRHTSMRSDTGGDSASESGVSNDEYCVQFYYGNPSVEMVKGVLHLFRENERTSLKPNVARSSLLCMLAVPAYLSTHDLLRFAAPFAAEIERLKIIRDQTPNQYMVLLRFRSQESADLFYDHFNGVPFTSIEPGICHLAYVAKVDCVQDMEGGGMSLKGVTELPTCAFCLERMDEAANGVLTILCNHSFHSACLDQWVDSSCPVCRYFQTPQMAEEQACSTCGMSSDDLWLCVICGNIGCGRYSDKHAFVHFEETQHTYALNMKTQRVWDYVGDGYVHRLIQGQDADNKVVEYQAGSGQQDEKLESITLEYTYLLTTQLESQRHYFEERIENLARAGEEEREKMRRNFDELFAKEKQLSEQRRIEALCAAERRAEELGQELEARLTKERDALDKKYQQTVTKLVKVTKDLETEKHMNECLRSNQNEHTAIIEKLKKEKELAAAEASKEITDLKEQITDLMFHMQTTSRVEELPEAIRQEIQEGNINTQASARSGASTSSAKSRARRRNE
ncbi:hypothetical protein RvY_18393 [Ramazzottius varieornatus]|uniref:BRCA1-associated protein n=1 Tax=Ramazzottius varieornatus TaxID=947166 RepID=A0A1D1W5K8_RAMVA|nr:hypothetical protein RvY_18393 [Ramazzottius varieornatus]